MGPLVELIPEDQTGTWVEFGAGEGVFSDLLGRLHPRSNPLRTDLAKSSYHKDLVTSLPRIPFRPNSLSGVIAAQVLHFLSNRDVQLALGQIETALIDGGHILIVEYITRKMPWVPNPLSHQDFERLTRDTSLQVVDYLEMDPRRPKYGLVLQKKL